MKAIIFSTLILLVIRQVIANEGLQTKSLNQRLNHFGRDFTEWQQRYFVNTDYFYTGGPIFIYISGQFDTFQLLHMGEVYDFNKIVNGVLFGLEHRYFGRSLPTLDTSTENLEYLTVEQAVADIAFFVKHIKEKYPGVKSSKVILFGEGNGGALAVWARQKYPHLVDGVWASSAYVRPVINHGHLAINIGQTYKNVGGQRCYDVISNAFETLDLLVWSREANYIKDAFKLCSAINTDNEFDVASLNGNLVQLIQQKLELQSYKEIEASCETLTSEENDNDFSSFSKWFRNDLFPAVNCFNFNSQDLVSKYQLVEWGTVATIGGDRQQLYLRCAQLGQFATSDADVTFQPFGNSFGLKYFIKFCDAVFGQNFTDVLERENSRFFTSFGGLDLAVTNVFFSQGEFDPKITLGLVEDLNKDSPVVLIPNHSKGTDLKPATPEDAPELSETKRRAKLNLMKWILDAESEEETEQILNRLGGVPF